jgi:hypothetical protein
MLAAEVLDDDPAARRHPALAAAIERRLDETAKDFLAKN